MALKRLVLGSLLLLFVQASGTTASENPFLLRQRLHDAVIGQKVLRYSEVWTALEDLDASPGEPSTVELIYTRRNEPVRHRDHGQNDPNSWNREHLWPKSHGFPEEANPAYTDVVNLRPADRSVNTDRSDRDFDDGGLPHEEARLVRWDKDSWEVPDEVKGDVARSIFYMALRYDGTGFWVDRKGSLRQEAKLMLVEGNSPSNSQPLFGNKATLLRWNRLDPPDRAEQRRNEGVARIQGRLNPFVLHPEYIDELWGALPQ